MIKLHLGCGKKHITGYTNIDIRFLPGVDEVDNIKFLKSYSVNSVTEIYACHVLEHFSRWEYKHVLQRWYELLIPSGILKLAVPDFDSICLYYSKTQSLTNVLGLLYGGQDYDENYHKMVFNFGLLNETLSSIGFKHINIYDRNKTEHSNIDDYSAAYLPHLDQNGTLMSLNIIAKK